jgi:beta-lactamase regulating signal transducer with metallopeptidase domain
MTEFLVSLGKVNLAMSAAIFAVYIFRHPVRAAFHAQIAYGLWLLVPVAAIASLLPPRAVLVSHVEGATFPTAVGTMQSALPVPQNVSMDWAPLLLVAWLAGTFAMALYLMRLQHRFHLAERDGTAGPAVAGLFRPRIVIPAKFHADFSQPEQEAILAHERAHLSRQDARVNALIALLRCLCWFNPLVQIGAIWMRRDQELACDAAALRAVSRLDYARALLKSQMTAMALPLGCAWPGSEHPLTERVALLKHQPPKSIRRCVGVLLVALTVAAGGLGAWAAQPPTVREAAGEHRILPCNMFTTKNPGQMIAGLRRTVGGVTVYVLLQSKTHETLTNGNIVGTGNVQLCLPNGIATADTFTEGVAGITLTGNVAFNDALGMLKGKKLVFEPHTGALDLDDRKLASGWPNCSALKADSCTD